MVVNAIYSVSITTVPVIHARGDNLCPVQLLLASIELILDCFIFFFENVLMVWSEIVSRVVWTKSTWMQSYRLNHA